ncbi:MAG: peptide ABC transporter ATP-binding protein [Elusimicrobia bacterium RIFOXYB2_FULL_49_7]|nr:MAG: peptide ABC transporter ATP-binding protein [Elusimicrobia bacterium RIFOXYB2_FULL_49_7]
MPLLDVKNLTVRFNTDDGVVNAVDNLSFSLEAGKTLCVVGESGCGKSVTAHAIMRLLPTPPAEITSGNIVFRERSILSLPEKEMRKLRGNEMAMIFQDPMTSLNPVFTCGYQIEEALLLHQGLDKKEAQAKAVEMLKLVRIPDPDKRVNEYPHQMSGGMRQRIMIAMALSCNPSLLIADEPTTALDVTIQAQILNLLAELKASRQMSVIFITHDLGIVAEIADEVLVLYAGRVAERGSVKQIYENPKHPYTLGLLNSIPVMQGRRERLNVIAGTLPDPTDYPEGCRFYDRCSRADAACLKRPLETEVESGHFSACFHME